MEEFRFQNSDLRFFHFHLAVLIGVVRKMGLACVAGLLYREHLIVSFFLVSDERNCFLVCFVGQGFNKRCVTFVIGHFSWLTFGGFYKQFRKLDQLKSYIDFFILRF